NGHFYVFEISDAGDVGIWRREDDHWIDLLSWTHSDAVRQGTASNDLSVRAIGSELTFTVNGIEVAGQTDENLGAGGVGVFVGGDANEVALDRFTVRPHAT